MARMRSPNFPALTLEEAMKVAGELYSKVRKVTLDREAAAKELGYSGLTGRSLKVLGALNQYGLIDNVSKGKCHITDLAETALHGFPEEEKAGAIRRAARAPALFRAIYDEYGEDIKSEHAIRSLLLKRGFTDKGVESALQSFLATQRFAALNGGSGNYSSVESNASELSPNIIHDEGDFAAHDNQSAAREATPPPPPLKALYRDQPLEFSLSSKGLAVTGGTNSAQELRVFIKKLEALAALLPDDEAVN